MDPLPIPLVAWGIEKVIYIDSYPKSLAFELHKDSIVLDAAIPPSRGVVFESFVGVSANRYVELFRERKRKNDASKIVDASLIFLTSMKSDSYENFAYLAREGAAFRDLNNSMKEKGLLDEQGEFRGAHGGAECRHIFVVKGNVFRRQPIIRWPVPAGHIQIAADGGQQDNGAMVLHAVAVMGGRPGRYGDLGRARGRV